MKILSSRKTATLITVVVAILAVLFGVHRSLNSLARDIEAMFYKEGYAETNIDAQLNKQVEAVTGVVTITKNYPELETQTEDLQQARLEYLAAGSISDKGYASLKMGFALEQMLTPGTENNEGFNKSGVEFNERDETALKHYLETYLGASNVIDNGSRVYNSEVEKFLSGELYSPIAGILKPLVFVEPPQLFINYQS